MLKPNLTKNKLLFKDIRIKKFKETRFSNFMSIFKVNHLQENKLYENMWCDHSINIRLSDEGELFIAEYQRAGGELDSSR